jgi:hypothetical protein
MKKSLFGIGPKAIVLFAISAYLFASSCKDCSPCQDRSKYDTLFVNQQDKCKHVILRRVNNTDTINWKDIFQPYSPDFIDTVPGVMYKRRGPIDTMLARKYIQNYNEIHNQDLMNTSFIDFDKNEILLYIIEVMNWLKQTDPTDELTNIRVYLSNNGTKNSTIIIAVTKKGELITHKDLKPIDFGGLCPPPDGCITDKNAKLLQRAIDVSRNPVTSTSIRRPNTTW